MNPGAAAAVWRRAWALSLACALWCCCASSARAWTRASVETAEARVEVLRSGRARVALTLGVRVYGGWLSLLPLSDLGRDLELDANAPASIECEDGRTLTPALRADPRGHVTVAFGDKQSAPRRGLHRLSLHYSIALSEAEAANDATSAVGFALPAFAVDLRQADLWIEAPAGSRLVRPDADAALQLEQSQRADGVVFHLHRDRLPRTVAFGAQMTLPSSVARARAANPRPAAAPRGVGPMLASALLLVLCMLKRRAVQVVAGRCRVRVLPLVDFAPPWRGATMFGAAAAAAATYDLRPELGLALLALCVGLSLERSFASTGSSQESAVGTAKRVTWRELLFGGASWVDATTPLGASLLGSAYALAFLRLALGQGPGLWLETLLLATPLWLTGTRMQMQDISRASASAVPTRAPTAALKNADASPRASDRAA